MAVDLVVTENEEVPPYRQELSLRFDEDGYYWFLYPLFEELYALTGNMIDLYGNATFEAETLPFLQEMGEKARLKVARKPKNWDVRIGYQYTPKKEPILKTVNRQRFLSMLDQLDKMIDWAIKHNEKIECLGD